MRRSVVVFSGLVLCSGVAFGDPRQLFDKGAWKDAVAEATHDIAANPKDGKPHAAFAQLLVNMGLGDAARREARLAVQLQPDVAFHHVVLGWTLAHDLFGRSYAIGSDRAGALAELKKARKLDPKSFIAAAELGNLLAHGDRGKLWGRGSDAKAAAAAKRVAYDLDPTAATGAELLKALVWAGDFAGAEQLAKVAPRSDDRDGLWLVAIAGHSDAAAAIRAADTLATPAAKKQALDTAARTLFGMRRYDDARALFAELRRLGQQSADFADLAVHDKPLDLKTPAGAALEAKLVFVRDGKQQAMWDAKTETEITIEWNVQNHLGGHSFDWSDEVFGDMLRTATTSHVEGDKKAWRIELATAKGKPEVLYAADDHGTIKLIGAAANTHGVGRHAMRLIASNDLETARRLLDWVSKDAKRRPMFDIVWGPNHATDREAVELAAAVLVGVSDPDHARPILEQCAGAPPNGDVACTMVLEEINEMRGAWDDAIAMATARLAAHPKEAFTGRILAFALAHAGRAKEAEAIVRDIAPPPTDSGFYKLRMDIAFAKNDVPAAIEIAEAATKLTSKTAADFNELAWLEVVTSTKLADAVVAAGEAVRLDATANDLHTKALAEAESGDLRSALDDAHKALALRLHEAPMNADWYLHGRIAELVGLPEDAIAAYRQVKPLAVQFSVVPDSYTLAKRRLADLGTP